MDDTSTGSAPMTSNARHASIRWLRHVPPPLTRTQRDAIKRQALCGLCFVGPFEPITIDSKQVRAIAPVLNSSWRDTVSEAVDKASPQFAMGLLLRGWLRTKVDALRLLAELPRFMSRQATKQRGEWWGLPVQTDPMKFQIDLTEFANGLGLELLDDLDVLKELRAASAGDATPTTDIKAAYKLPEDHPDNPF